MLIHDSEIEGVTGLDVRVCEGRVAEIGRGLALGRDEDWLDGDGGALVPGLHDHHLHLFALAASHESLACGPPQVSDGRELATVLAHAPGDGWIRAIGYHESVAGELSRAALDQLVPVRPLRLQHRTGVLWMLNSTAIERLGLDAGVDHACVERGPDGRASGRLWHADGWLREQLGRSEPPCLRRVGRQLASYGTTGVTDATAGNTGAELAALRHAQEQGDLPQRLLVMGAPSLPSCQGEGIARGPLKLVLAEDSLPEPGVLESQVRAAHAERRPVAVHCVTRAELVYALEAIAVAGVLPGDRIEHASLAPPDTVERLAELGLTVVTQPGFLRARGEQYRREVGPRDLPWLYRCRGFLTAGVPLGGGTDAPFGPADPWLAMRAAVDRQSDCGHTLGAEEQVTPEQALALFTSPPHAPGAAPRRVQVGAPADLCLLDRP